MTFITSQSLKGGPKIHPLGCLHKDEKTGRVGYLLGYAEGTIQKGEKLVVEMGISHLIKQKVLETDAAFERLIEEYKPKPSIADKIAETVIKWAQKRTPQTVYEPVLHGPTEDYYRR